MKWKEICVSAGILIISGILIFQSCIPHWASLPEEIVCSANGVRIKVIFASKTCIYLAMPHAHAHYLTQGATRVSVEVIGAQHVSFESSEDMTLMAVHYLNGRVYLIFKANYEVRRGFSAFECDKKGTINSIKLAELPKSLVVPNFGPAGNSARQYLCPPIPAKPPEKFYNTLTAWLWWQTTTGESIHGKAMNAGTIDEFWKSWAPEIARACLKTKIQGLTSQ